MGRHGVSSNNEEHHQSWSYAQWPGRGCPCFPTFKTSQAHISKHTATAPLYTETGILPVAARRTLVLLRCLKDYIQQAPDHYITHALKQHHILRLKNKFNWLSDVDDSLRRASHNTLRLPPLPNITVDVVTTLEKDLKTHVWTYLEAEIRNNHRLYLLHDRLEPLQNGTFKHINSCLRHYLVRVTVPAHRRSLTKLIFGESVYYTASLHGVPEDQRFCRMCHRHVETPEHAIFQCNANERVTQLRRTFFGNPAVSQIYGPLQPLSDVDALICLKKFIFHYDIVPLTAQLVHNVYRIWSGKEGGQQKRVGEIEDDDSEFDIDDGEEE